MLKKDEFYERITKLYRHNVLNYVYEFLLMYFKKIFFFLSLVYIIFSAMELVFSRNYVGIFKYLNSYFSISKYLCQNIM